MVKLLRSNDHIESIELELSTDGQENVSIVDLTIDLAKQVVVLTLYDTSAGTLVLQMKCNDPFVLYLRYLTH